jgi:hypothetical protein
MPVSLIVPTAMALSGKKFTRARSGAGPALLLHVN